MRNIKIIIIIFFGLISCSEGDNQQIRMLSDKEIINLILEYNSVKYQTEIQERSIELKDKLPFGVKKVRVKSMELSDKATSYLSIGDEIDISTGNYEIVIMAEDQTTKTYNLIVEFEEEQFTLIEYEPVSVSKTYSKPVYVHYMPWFETPEFAEFGNSNFNNWGIHWTMANKNPENFLSENKREIATHYYPLIGPYDNGEPDYCEYAAVLIKLSGIDGVIFDYPGHNYYSDNRLIHDHTIAMIPWLEKVGLKFAVSYEDVVLNGLSDFTGTSIIELAKEHFIYMDNNFFNKDFYFKISNTLKPVVLNFGPQVIKNDDEWLDVFSETDMGVNFFPLAYHPKYYNLTTSASGVFAWVGEVQNNDLYNYSEQFDFTGGGAMFEFREFYEEGGWGTTGQSDISNKNGDLFKETLERAKVSNVDFIQLITWNDWGEGTAIEPSLDYGFHQLTIIQEFVGMQPNPSDLELAVKLYQKRKKFKGKELENRKLDQVFYYLISLQLDKARNLLNEL